jgi:hypothetical protein
MERTAASRLPAVRSGIFTLAISASWALVILPTLSLLGVALPLARPSFFMISTAAGGVFRMKLKLRSAKTVMTTGRVVPFSTDPTDFALNCFTNSMMLTPCWPSAGPTGGAGVASPAGSCSLM